jgi:type IV pilus assembly protein PilA
MARKVSRTSFLALNDSLAEPMLKYRRTRGFTIVELLIVIVVIAILAAITVAAYTGIRERANLSAVQSELSGQARLLANHRAQYPATLAAARTAGMLNNTSGTETRSTSLTTRPTRRTTARPACVAG